MSPNTINLKRPWPQRTVRTLLAAMSVGALLIVGVGWAGHAKASPGLGCETIAAPGLLAWGQKRTICDSPRRADGSWWRTRQYWTPAHYVPVACSSGRYSSSCSGGYHVGDSIARYEEYPVTDETVLPDEPGWLPTGSVVIR